MEKETKQNDSEVLESEQEEEFKMLSEEEQLGEITAQKYDPESNTRNVSGVF